MTTMNLRRRQKKKVFHDKSPFHQRLYNFIIANWISLLIVFNLVIFLWLLRPRNQTNNTPDFPSPQVQLSTSAPRIKIIYQPQPSCFLFYGQNFSSELNIKCINDYYDSNDEIHLETEINQLTKCYSSINSYYKSPNDYFKYLPIAIVSSSHKKIISFSLYGSSDRYFHAIVKIIRAYRQLLPSWIPRFWLGSDVPFTLINRLLYEGAEIIIVYPKQGNQKESRKASFHGMFWRFFVAEDVNVERYIVRDADSLPIQREIDAINQWKAERTLLHIMRDHEQHGIEILGGMWGGLVNPRVLNVSRLYGQALIEGYDSLGGKGLDQSFLKKYVWPIARTNMTCHVSYHWKFVDNKGCKQFPTQRVNNSYVGAIISY